MAPETRILPEIPENIASRAKGRINAPVRSKAGEPIIRLPDTRPAGGPLIVAS